MRIKFTLLAVLATCSVAFIPAAANAKTPIAHAAGRCSVPNRGEHLGYTYLTSLSVTNTSCTTGLNLAKDKGKLKGWKCSNKVLSRSPVQYIGQETCTSGKAKVVYGYSQNT